VPTYQYQCTECGENLEVVQKFTDDALTICPNCQGALRKVYSAVGIVFKGSGFYRTDSRASSGSGSKSGSGGGSTDGSSSSPASTQSSSTSSSDSGSSAKSGGSGSSSGSGGSGSGGGSSPAAAA
jgi:putative FmdB family regulatory protein